MTTKQAFSVLGLLASLAATACGPSRSRAAEVQPLAPPRAAPSALPAPAAASIEPAPPAAPLIAGADIDVEVRTLISGHGCSTGHDLWAALDAPRRELVILLANGCDYERPAPRLHRCPVDGRRPCSVIELPVTLARGCDTTLDATLDVERSAVFLLYTTRHNLAHDLRVESAAFRCTDDGRCAGPVILGDVSRRDPQAGEEMRSCFVPADIGEAVGWPAGGGGLSFASASRRGSCRGAPFTCVTSSNKIENPEALADVGGSPDAGRIAFFVDTKAAMPRVVAQSCDAFGNACTRAPIQLKSSFKPTHLVGTTAGSTRHIAVAGREGEHDTGYYVRCSLDSCHAFRFPDPVVAPAGVTVDPSGARLWFYGHTQKPDATVGLPRLVSCDAIGHRGCRALTLSRELGHPWIGLHPFWIEGALHYLFIDEAQHLDVKDVIVPTSP